MISLTRLGALFLQGCREPNCVRMRHLLDTCYEPEYQRLESEGRPLRWVSENRLRQYSREGWRPVTKPDSSGCPTVFMDRTGALVLLYQAERGAPAQTPALRGIQPRFICTDDCRARNTMRQEPSPMRSWAP